MDECISQFTGCAKEKIIIPTKLIPAGTKTWVFSDNGYFVYWFWYAKGDGPQGISKISKPLGRNKIVVVVLALLNTLPQAPPGIYSVILDNLFIFIKLLIYLSAKGFGARGTIRTKAGVY